MQASEDASLDIIGKSISSFLFSLPLFFLKCLDVQSGLYPVNQVCLFFSTVQAIICINIGLHFIEFNKFWIRIFAWLISVSNLQTNQFSLVLFISSLISNILWFRPLLHKLNYLFCPLLLPINMSHFTCYPFILLNRKATEAIQICEYEHKTL